MIVERRFVTSTRVGNGCVHTDRKAAARECDILIASRVLKPTLIIIATVLFML